MFNLKSKKIFKKSMKMIAIVFASSMLLTSCFSYITVVGERAKGNNETTQWNNYVI